MKHREAMTYLPDLAAGSLPADAAVPVARHVETCRSCADWLSLYSLLGQHLASTDISDVHHPDSDLLASYALHPEEMSEVQSQRLRRHLDCCADCREELELSHRAVLEARPGAGHASRDRQSAIARRWVGLAAGIAALLVCGALLFNLFSRADRGFGQASSNLRATGSTAQPEEMSVSDRRFEGVEVVHAETSMRVTNTEVQPGADVAFSAGGVVAFGDGFRVAEGGRITVTSRRSGHPSPGDPIAPR